MVEGTGCPLVATDVLAGKSSLMRTETSTAANLLDIGIFTKDTKNDKGISTKFH